MEIMFEKCLRDVLAKRGKTQRELAEHLSISTQAVSKWCRGENMPDIALLPKMAYFLDVSVDELLGVGEIRKQEKIAAYRKEYEALMHEGYSRKAVELMRRAHNEFPNDLGIMYLLSNALQAAQPSPEEEQEVIALCDMILSKSTDSDLRALTVQTKCMAYSGLGDMENGRKCAESAQGIWQSVNALLPMFLKGEELKECSQSNILDFTSLICTQIQRIAKLESDIERRLMLLKTALKLYDVIFDDGNYGHFAYGVFRIHLMIAWCYAKMQNEEQTRLHLETAEKYAEESMNIKAKNKSVFTSTLLDGFEFDMTELHKPSPKTDFDQILETLDSAKVYDPYRKCEWFIALEKRLNDQNSKII